MSDLKYLKMLVSCLLMAAIFLHLSPYNAHAAGTGSGSVQIRDAVASAACVHGQRVELDLRSIPASYRIEIRYSVGGVYVPLEAVSEVTGDVLYSRKGSVVSFRCGDFAEYPEGPEVDGDFVGPAIGYRVTWMMIF